MPSLRVLAVSAALLPMLSPGVSAQGPTRPVPYPVTPPAEFQAALTKGTRTTTGRPGTKYWQQFARYTFNAKLDVEHRALEGTGKILYFNRSPDTLSTIVLHLYQNIHAGGAARNEAQPVTPGFGLRRVVAGGQTIARDTRMGAGYRIEGTLLTLRLPKAVLPGDSLELLTDWQFVIPQNGAGRMGWSAENLFFLAYWYPQVAVYDDVNGWDRSQYLGAGEFYMGYADYDITIDAPRGWLITGTGDLQNADSVLSDVIVERLRRAAISDQVVPVVTSEDIWSNKVTKPGRGNRLSWRFKATNVRDFSFSASKESKWDAVRAEVGDRNGDGQTDYTRVDAVYRAIASLWPQAAKFGRHSVAYFSKYTGLAYPWSHMSIIEGENIVGGGMEYPMLTLIASVNEGNDSLLYTITTHEIAHMWIPMIVGADETRYGWMDEGTTDFNETQARKDFYPGSDPETGERAPYLRVAGTSREDAMMRWTNFQLPGAYVVSSYQKPATVLYALRGLIGEDRFLAGLRGFIKDWSYKHPTPWDFFTTFNTAAGKNLDWFWRSWYYETWTLDQAIVGVTTGAQGTWIQLEDKGLVPMPARLTITLSSGETLQREVEVDHWLSGQKTAAITLPVGQTVTKVEIDAAKAFPDVDRSNNTWEKQS